MKTNVREMWESFRTAVIPADASTVQLEAMRDGFYAGAQAMFSLIVEASSPEDEAAGVANLNEIEAELGAFHDEIRHRVMLLRSKGAANA